MCVCVSVCMCVEHVPSRTHINTTCNTTQNIGAVLCNEMT